MTNYVRKHLASWQEDGFVPDMPIESGVETARLLRERGWTYWHHLYTPRQLLIAALVAKEIAKCTNEEKFAGVLPSTAHSWLTSLRASLSGAWVHLAVRTVQRLPTASNTCFTITPSTHSIILA